MVCRLQPWPSTAENRLAIEILVKEDVLKLLEGKRMGRVMPCKVAACPCCDWLPTQRKLVVVSAGSGVWCPIDLMCHLRISTRYDARCCLFGHRQRVCWSWRLVGW